MKRSKSAFCLFAAAFFAALFFSCGDFSSFAIPETVSVKSSARYVGALGQKCYDLSEKLGPDFIADLEENAGGNVYKYIPDPSDQTLQYLLRKKVYDVPFDISGYIDGMKLDSSLAKDFSFSKDIELPEIKKSITPIPIPVGFSADVPFSLPDVSLTLDDVIKEAVIGEGSIVVKAEGEAAGCYSVGEFTLEGITKNDGSAYSASDFAAGSGSGTFIINQELSLSGAKLVLPASQIKASGKLVKGSGSITTAGTLNISLSVEKLSTVKADLSAVGKFVMSDSENTTQIPAEMVAYVRMIKFGQDNGSGVYYKHDKDGNVSTTVKSLGKGIKFKAINSLPAGNDIALNVASTTFGISASETIEAKANDTAFEKSVAGFSDIDVTDTSIFGTKVAPKNIQFSVTLSNNQTFTNLETGKTYKIGVSDAELLFDWDLVTLDLSSADPVSDKADLSDFSIDKILSEVDGEMSKLIDNCAFKKVPVYFLAQKPKGDLAGVIGNVTLSGKVCLKYKDSTSTDQTIWIAGSATTEDAMNPCDPIDWPASGEVFTKAFSAKGTDFTFDFDMADTLNARPTDLTVDYSMGFTGGNSNVDLYKAYIDSLGSGESTSIAVEMAAVLPIELTVTADTDLDIYKIAEKDMDGEEDLMYRESVSDTATYAKYAGAISYMQLDYNFINNAVDGFSAKIFVDDTHQGEPDANMYSGIKREITIDPNGAGGGSINLSSDEIRAALTHFFMPKMTLRVNAGDIKIKRSAIESSSSIGINPMVILQLNDSVAVDITDIIKN